MNISDYDYEDDYNLTEAKVEAAWQKLTANKSICRCNSASEEPCYACQNRMDEGEENEPNQ